MNTELDKVKAKILALLAKAQSTNIEAEASTFLAKASEMMEKYQLELFDLGVEDPIGVTQGVVAQPGPPSYKSDVQRALAHYYGARPVIVPIPFTKKWTTELCGPESSRMTTVLMTDFVWSQVNASAKKLSEEQGYNRQEAIRHVAKALCYRIRLEVATRRATPETRGGSAFSLVVVDATKAFMESHYGKLVTSKGRPKSLSQSALEAAKGISINVQVGKNAPLRLN